MLQGSAHLYLERNGRQRTITLQPTDVMQRVVAEARQLVSLALVDGVAPINGKEALDNACNLIDVVGIERNDADTHQVSDV